MADYGQNSTSPGSFSVEIGDVSNSKDDLFSQKVPDDRAYKTSHDEFQFMQSSSVNGDFRYSFVQALAYLKTSKRIK